MFTNETPIKSRRQSFKSFTNQLLINQQHSKSTNQMMSTSNSNSNSSDLPPTPSSPPQSIIPPPPQQQQPQKQTLPSASLILRQTNKLNPRLPRPSNLAHSTIPHSYAYGAAPTVSELSDQSSSTRRPAPRQSIPTGPTADHPTEPRNPQPVSTNSSNTTSVMIASAFERARWAARASEALSAQPRPQDPSPPPLSPSSVNHQNTIKKRRKSRKSFDPSYKYKPGDSATSDSEAGEGIADKRDRREKKLAAAAAAEAAAGGSGHQTTSAKQTNKRRRRTTNQHESETDSDEEGGEGIALTRGRRSIKPPATFDNSNNKPARKRKALNPKSSRNGTSNVGSETESQGTASVNQSTRRRTTSHRGTSDGNRTDDQSSVSKPTATFYLEHPDSPETSRMPIEEDHTMGTTDDSRFTVGPGAESYEYEEEERIVKALEAEERAHREEVNEPSLEMNQSLSLEESQSRSSDPIRRSHSSHLDDSYNNRSDSGLIEIEQVIASSKLQSQPPKLRKLPIKASHNLITPIEELDESRISSPFPPASPITRKSSKNIGFGTSVGSKVLRQLSKISKYSSSFYWKVAMLIFLLALMINSIRVGDLPMSIFSRRKPSGNVFIKPETPIENFEELVSRLKNLESELWKISSGSESVTRSLSETMSETRMEMFQRIGSIELSIEDQSRLIEATKENSETKLNKLESGLGDLKREVGFGAKSIGRVEKSLAGLNKEIIGIEGKIKESLEASSKELRSDEGLSGIVMDPVTGEWKMDSRLMNYFESLYVSREKVERSLMERDEKLRSWISKEIATHQVPVPEGGKRIEGIEESDQLDQLISQSILKFSLTDGGINQPDYALLSGGARVIPDLTSLTLELKPKGIVRSTLSWMIGGGNLVMARPPSTVLEPDKSIGKCWPMSGDVGQIGIALARKVVVREIVIEHVQFDLAYELDSAVREFEVHGYDSDENGWKKLGDGTFDLEQRSAVQRFGMNEEVRTQMVVVKVLSNYGNKEFTCLYRIRVLGERRDDQHAFLDQLHHDS